MIICIFNNSLSLKKYQSCFLILTSKRSPSIRKNSCWGSKIFNNCESLQMLNILNYRTYWTLLKKELTFSKIWLIAAPHEKILIVVILLNSRGKKQAIHLTNQNTNNEALYLMICYFLVSKQCHAKVSENKMIRQ